MPGQFPTEQPQHPPTTTFSAPPQIPEQNLKISTVDEDWSLSFGDVKNEVTDRSATTVPHFAGGEAQRNYSSTSALPNQSSHLTPTALPETSSTLALAPSSNISVISHTDNEVPSRSISEVTRSGEERSPIGRISQEDARHSRNQVSVGAVGLAAAGVTVTTVTDGRDDSATYGSFLTLHAANNKSVDMPTGNQADIRMPSTTKPAPDTEQYKRDSANKEGHGKAGEIAAEFQDKNVIYDTEANTSHTMTEPGPSSKVPDVPETWRHSSISNISGLDQAPGIPDEVTRIVSTAPDSRPLANQNSTPSYSDSASKDVEAAQAEFSQQQQHGLLSHQNMTIEAQRYAPTERDPNSEIISASDHSARRRDETQLTQPRPFSFGPSNALVEPIRQNDGLLKSREAPTKSTIPAGEPLNKERSNVSVEEVPDESRNPGNQTSKSQLGAEPNVGDHLASRSSPTPVNSSQMYSSENPLPSARLESPLPSARRGSPLPSANRSPQDFNRHRQESVPQPQPEEQYRIPGPYVQEYRSPKQPPQGSAQRPWPTDQQQQHNQVDPMQYQQQQFSPMGRPQNQQQQSNQMGQPQNQQQQSNQMGQPQNQQRDQQLPRPNQQRAMAPLEKPKHITIGSLFRNRSKSRSRDGHQDTLGEKPSDRREKLNSLFKTKSRQDSADSSRRESESRDQVSSLPHRTSVEANDSKPRRSRDMFRSPTFGSTGSEDGKKKRNSGLGSLFSRGSKSGPKRASTTQSTSGRPSTLETAQQEKHNQQALPSQRNNADSSRRSPENFRGTPPPPDGYFAPTNQYSERARVLQHPASTFSHGPDSVVGQYPPNQQARYPEGDSKSQPYHSNWMPQYHQPQQKQMDHRQYDQRPLNLRIDTGGSSNEYGAALGNRSQYSNTVPANTFPANTFPANTVPANTVPATAPPVLAPHSYHYQSSGNPAIHSYEQPLNQAQFSYPSFDQSQSQSQFSYQQSRNNPQSAKPSYPTTHAPLAPSTSASATKASSTNSHVADLHKRSRSPRHGRLPSEDNFLDATKQDSNDPVSQLGTFKNRSPAGDATEQEVQEKPWRIDLPEAEEREAKRKAKQLLIERGGTSTSPTTGRESATKSPVQGSGVGLGQGQEARPLTVAEKIMGAQRSPLSPSTAAVVNTTSAGRDVRSPGGAGGKEWPVAELPGSKAEGYESEEEIPMCATAYPGQEWMPYGAQEMGYGRWDD
jgi:hypothetical protein